MATLYVIEPDSRLEKEYNSLLVTRNDEVILKLPLRNITQVVLVGQAGATTQALHALLREGIGLILVSRGGKLLGRLLPPTGSHLPLRQEQYRRNDDPAFCLALARSIVTGKVHNQRVLLLRLARRHPELPAGDIRRLEAQQRAALLAESLDALMGVEGYASKVYFGIFRQAFAPAFESRRRTRRPPQDPVNALLSLGYTFLGHAAEAALETVGLDPYLGFFHAEKWGRPALALDLIEEFRAPIVDSLALDLLNHGALEADDFQAGPGEEGVYLTPRGLRIFLEKFSQRLEAQVKPPGLTRALSYRKLLEVQAYKLAKVIQGEKPAYEPFLAR